MEEKVTVFFGCCAALNFTANKFRPVRTQQGHQRSSHLIKWKPFRIHVAFFCKYPFVVVVAFVGNLSNQLKTRRTTTWPSVFCLRTDIGDATYTPHVHTFNCMCNFTTLQQHMYLCLCICGSLHMQACMYINYLYVCFLLLTIESFCR